MKRWSECRTPREKIDAITAAFAAVNTAEDAARLLGMNRQYLYEVMHEYGLRRVGHVVTVGTVGESDAVGVKGSVGVSARKSLTYTTTKPSLQLVSTPAADVAEDVVRVVFDLPKSIVDWLEQEALRRKQDGVSHRMAKSPIVVELVRREMGKGEK